MPRRVPLPVECAVRAPRKRTAILVLTAGLVWIASFTYGPPRYIPYSRAEHQAVQTARDGVAVLSAARIALGYLVDAANDPRRSGLIGEMYTPITTTYGHLPAKKSATSPLWAGLVVSLMREAGVGRGDVVAASMSGSFPGLNLAVHAAADSIGVKLVTISSASASMWGANIPDFTWLDMERVLVEHGIVTQPSVAVTPGGHDDRGANLYDEGRHLLELAVERSNTRILRPDTLAESVAERLAIYREVAAGELPALFINVGGAHSSLGNRFMPASMVGLLTEPAPEDSGEPGILHYMLEQGVPVLHLLNIPELAARHGLPLD